jgi:hypothetical protein
VKSHELEALRRLLFFSQPEAALLVGDVGERAWRRWEEGSRAVPADVASRLRGLADWRQQAIDAAVRQIAESPPAAQIALLWYADLDDLDDWATLPGREPALWRPQQSVLAALLAEFASRIRLVPFDGPNYAAWLAGRPDSETLRGLWAAAN